MNNLFLYSCFPYKLFLIYKWSIYNWFGINSKISLRQSYYQVVLKRNGGLGRAISAKKRKLSDRGILFVIDELNYPGLDISFSYDTIEIIRIFREGIKTARNIEVGMRRNDVIKAYGKEFGIEQVEPNTQIITYSLAEDENVLIDSYRIQFIISDQKVKSIVLQTIYNVDKILKLEDFYIIKDSNKKKYHIYQDIKNITEGLLSEEYEVITETLDKNTQYESTVSKYKIGNCTFYIHSRNENGVYKIKIDGSGWQTFRGIKTGDSKEDVLKSYGIYDEHTVIKTNGKEVLIYIFTNFGEEKVYGKTFSPLNQSLLLEFFIKNDIVKKIYVSVQRMGSHYLLDLIRGS